MARVGAFRCRSNSRQSPSGKSPAKYIYLSWPFLDKDYALLSGPIGTAIVAGSTLLALRHAKAFRTGGIAWKKYRT